MNNKIIIKQSHPWLNQEYIDMVTVRAGDTIALLSGGHGIKINEDCKFVEVKQGPYVEEKDKIRF